MNKLVKPKVPCIRIFFEDTVDGETVKHYIHDTDTYLKAYVRQLSATEQTLGGGVQDQSVVRFVINHRDVEVDMFVEFKGRTYQITGVDRFEFRLTDIVFDATGVATKTYDSVIWADTEEE